MLKQYLGFSYLVLPFSYLVVCMLFVLSQRFQMCWSGFPAIQIAAWALAVVINAWPQQPLAVSRWCSTAATTSNLIKQGSPYQSRGCCKGLCWQCTTTAIETLMSHWAVSSPSVPIPAVQGDGKPWGLSRHSGRLTVGGVFLPQERRLRGC